MHKGVITLIWYTYDGEFRER